MTALSRDGVPTPDRTSAGSTGRPTIQRQPPAACCRPQSASTAMSMPRQSSTSYTCALGAGSLLLGAGCALQVLGECHAVAGGMQQCCACSAQGPRLDNAAAHACRGNLSQVSWHDHRGDANPKPHKQATHHQAPASRPLRSVPASKSAWRWKNCRRLSKDRDGHASAHAMLCEAAMTSGPKTKKTLSRAIATRLP